MVPRLMFIVLISLVSVAISEQDHTHLADQSELYIGKEYQDAFKNPADNSELPNVLLIGDSISIGYTVEVRKLLANKADVFRIPTNGKNSAYGLRNLDKWLQANHWDVIHFNWGLWDVCYRHPKSKTQGKRDKVNGTLTTTPDDYKENIIAIVEKLKQTKAQLIWSHTTPVPQYEEGRKVGDEIIYNNIAAAVMNEHHILVNDLHAHAALRVPEIFFKKGDVHFTKEGYAYLAKKVAQDIQKSLNKLQQ